MWPETLMGQPVDGVVKQVLFGVGLGISLNSLVSWAVKGTAWAESGGHLEAPRWSYAAACFFQLAIFPTLFFFSLSEYPSLWEHTVSSWDECSAAGFCWMRVFMIVLISYLSKDIMVCNTLEKLHHVAGILFTFGFMMTTRGAHGYITGCVMLEGANFFMNLSHMWPVKWEQSRLRVYALVVFIDAVAHVATLYSVYITDINHDPKDSPLFFIAHFLTASVVMTLRQKTKVDNYNDVRRLIVGKVRKTD